MKAAGAAEAEWGLSVGAVGQTCTCCDGKLGPAFWLLPPPSRARACAREARYDRAFACRTVAGQALRRRKRDRLQVERAVRRGGAGYINTK